VQRSLPLSTDAAATPLVAAGALVIAAVGVTAEGSLYAWDDVWRWLPDLLTGWTIAGAGLVVLWRVPSSRAGALLTASGLAWFLGNFESSGVNAIAWAGQHGVLLHRALLVQLLLTFPLGRTRDLVERVAVATVYVISIATTVRWSDAGVLAVAVLLAVLAERRVRGSFGVARRAHRYAQRASMLLALALATVAVVYLLTDAAGPRRAAFLGYEATLCAIAAWVATGLLQKPWERAAVTDLVVDLGETRARSVRDALAQALGDPTLTVGYRLDGGRDYVDAGGRRLDLPAHEGRRRVTYVERDGEQVAVLIHDAALLDDPTLLQSVAAATRLAASNGRLQAEVRAQMRELAASRRRLLEAGDAERSRLERRLREGAAQRLARLGDSLAQARAFAGPASEERIAAAEAQLAKVSVDLAELAAGLHPHALTEGGLASSLAALAARSLVAVDLRVCVERLQEDIEVALFFVASEALANVTKYAGASSVSISTLAASGRVTLEIVDDGVGGANTASGSGLRGLADRVEAIGGTFLVESAAGRGTRLVAAVPLGDQCPSVGEPIRRQGR
jgi:signal transduction histidine kinase